MVRSVSLGALAALAAALAMAAPAQALTMKECGAKYQEAKTAGTLKGMKWNDFRKSQCGDDDVSPADAAAAETATPAPTPAAAPATPMTAEPMKAKPAATVKSGKVTFPSEISTKYANETPGKARMHTCVDQYNANKATGGNGDLKWIEKGGGYYSQCNTKLKS